MKQPYTVTLRERDTLKQIRAKVTVGSDPMPSSLFVRLPRSMKSQASFKVSRAVRSAGRRSARNIRSSPNSRRPRNRHEQCQRRGLLVLFYSHCYPFLIFSQVRLHHFSFERNKKKRREKNRIQPNMKTSWYSCGSTEGRDRARAKKKKKQILMCSFTFQ